ncbi:MAG: hypothetical protein PUD22_03035 [Erysipelotrichaceae bacterium]|nr:hypothetical protein [Erysipelotrichaceae bacterium]
MKKVLLVLLSSILLAGCAYADERFEVASDPFPIQKELLEEEKIYLAVGEEATISSDINYFSCSSSNEEAVEYQDGIVIGKSKGKSQLACSISKYYYDTVTIEVSDLYEVPHIDNGKPYLEEGMYTKEENDYLDLILAYLIDKAGYGTRAGVVEAARFLALRFPYRISYFYENGRMYTSDSTLIKVDGEGRYYHQGLYLDESRFEDIYRYVSGPATWGTKIYSYTISSMMRNGLDCSGYVSWAMLNGGFDSGDVGAGYVAETDFDLDDIGIKVKITPESIEDVKVGDFISRYGHIGILIGKDDENYYVAEALDTDLHVLTYDKEGLVNSSWEYFIDMDEYYGEDGMLTDMW